MQSFDNFNSMLAALGSRPEPVTVVVACPYDEPTHEAVSEALNLGIARFILVGEPGRITLSASDAVEIEAVSDSDAAAAKAVEIVREGRADVLMKGLINTDNLLRAILNKVTGILTPGSVLSHVTVSELPTLDRLLVYSDAAVIPFPDCNQMLAIAGNVAATCRAVGVEEPRVALIHCSEKTSPKFPVTEHYAVVREQAASGAYGNAIIDGPMDLKTALDAHSGDIKGIASPVGGRANGLVFPDIEAGNVFYKTVACLCGATNAGMLLGAKAPIVLPSRADSSRSKLCSIALAAVCSGALVR